MGQKIEVEIKDNVSQMRYSTVGDYYLKEDGTLKFEIVDTGSSFFNKMILIHEMIEQSLCEFRGLPNDTIDKFDFQFELDRKNGNIDEPGFDPDAPYNKEHTLATSVEMMMCALSGVSWKEYGDRIDSI